VKPHAPASHVDVAPVGGEHNEQGSPPLPHVEALVPATQAAAAQQPLHDAASHTHRPLAQRSPAPHEPEVHTPLHPSLAPQGLAAHVGVHVPAPQTFGPPPPHVRPPAQPPQSTNLAQAFIS
jgi:hypothetical protein